MRLKTMVTLAIGTAIGAGTMYALDPEHGPQRRRDARRRALRSARTGVVRTVNDLRTRATDVALAAAAGYGEARVPSPPQPATDPVREL